MREPGLARNALGPSGPLPACSILDRGEPGRWAHAVPAVPVLETARLRLRPFEPGDHAALHAILSRPESFVYSDRGAMSGEECWARLLRHIGHWAVMGFGMFAVHDKAGGMLIGEVGFADFRRGLHDRLDGVPEASWTIAPEHWGRGYAQEAALAAHRWIDAQGHGRTACMIHEANARSLRVAVKIGYEPFAATVFRGYRAVLLGRAAHGNG